MALVQFEEDRAVSNIDPKCSECYGRGWIHRTKEQEEAWYDANPDRSRPSYYAVSEPCPRCNPPSPSRLREWGDLFKSKARG